MHGMIDLQIQDPALNDAILHRFPEAVALLGICDASSKLGQDLVDQAHADGSLSSDFVAEDLFALLRLAGTASREPAAPGGWRQVLDRTLLSAWTS